MGSGAVRTISGTMAMHVELERRLAAFKQVEAVVVFQSGFAANAGTVSAMLDKDDVIISDALNHASIIDGCRLSQAPIKVFPHKDVAAARADPRRRCPTAQKKLLITDGVFSMDGDLGALPALCDLADEFGCIMMVDDAHASGVFGRQGRGTVDHFGCHGRVDIQVGTLSKAIGVLGGYVAGTRDFITFLHHRARPFLFSTSHPPAVTAACLAALDVLETEPQWMERLWDNTRFFKAGLAGLGFNTGTQREPDHAGHRRRGGAGHEDVGSALRRGRLRPGHRLPHRGQGRGPAAHHRLGHPHPRRPAVRPRRAWARSAGNSASSESRSDPPMPPLSRAREFFAAYTQDLTSDELSRLFTRDTPEAYRFFTRGIDQKAFKALPWHRRAARFTQAFFMAFTMRLTPARRVIYGVALVAAAIGVLSLFRGITMFGVPIIIPPFFFRVGIPTLAFAPGTQWLIFAFALMNLLVLLEVFDRLSLKRDLEVAREIQLAMLPDGTWAAPGRRGQRADAAGQHRRRRLLRHPAAARRARHHRARRRRRQGQPGGAADGAVPGDAAHAGGRAPDAAELVRAAEHPGRRSTRRPRASSPCSWASSIRGPASSST